jgi:hypothetical protein
MKPGILIQQLTYLCGWAQVALVIGSLAIPKILNWKQELAKVQPLIKQMFWTYAAYILVINLYFGLLSILDYNDISNGSQLSMLITGFIAIYWISRILIQFLYFDRTNFPTGRWNRLGEVVLVMLFVLLSAVYSWATFINYKQI